jgi:glutaminyl-tRNA synthetase
VEGYVEPSLKSAKGDEKFQFERHGYFVADLKDHMPTSPQSGEGGKPVFNRVAGMKDSWGK